MWLWIAVGLILLLAAFAYWVVVTTEGAYFGPRFVAWLYDRGASTYDRVKDFDPREEAWFLGEPLRRALGEVPHPWVLDVATGTARVALALLGQLEFDGQIVALDRSLGMLREARRKTARFGDRVRLIQHDATRLPFDDRVFDAVTCVESLEFLPDLRTTLAEMARVLRPGGVMLVTNRVGFDARLMPGRAWPQREFEGLLRSLGLIAVRTQLWQEHYDLVWARKPGEWSGAWVRRFADLMRCERCGCRTLGEAEEAVVCPGCGARWPWEDGILRMM